ncbi:zinc ribbon domain-containing protein [Aerosakkonema funiforme]|uniref:zinc ribbon domain-containing protein n=1 Tax=Aerosakkonema funiforme TaxID=1246630 RepID=UPI0038992B1E
MPLSARIFKCGNCGIELDRDFNASVNLEHWHPIIDYPLTVSSTGIACGGSHQLNGDRTPGCYAKFMSYPVQMKSDRLSFTIYIK